MHHDKKVSDTEQNSWQDKSLNNLYPHLIGISARRKNRLIVGDRSIQSMVKEIHARCSTISILPEENLAYTALLKATTLPGVTDSMYNKTMNHVLNLWTLNSEIVTILVIPSHQEMFFLDEFQILYMARINLLHIHDLSKKISN